MTTVHEIKCNSCTTTTRLDLVGGEWVMPHGWVDLVDRDIRSKGVHLCAICREAVVSMNLRETKIGKAILKIEKVNPISAAGDKIKSLLTKKAA